MAATEPQLLIIGGGIGGLALAQGCKNHGIKFHVYERDVAHNHRTQGYRIRVSREGSEALQYLLSSELHALLEASSAEMRLGPILEIDAITTEVAEVKFGHGNAPPPVDAASKPRTIDRTILRHLLLRGLDEHITYGKTLSHYETSATGVVAHFLDGTDAQGSLLVGADGSKSAVRRQLLPQATVLDTDGRCLYGKTLLTQDLIDELEPATLMRMSNIKDRTRPNLLSMVLEPITFPNRTEMAKHGILCPPDYLYWVMAGHPRVLNLPEDVTQTPKLSYDECATLALNVTERWHPKLNPIIKRQLPGETSLLPLLSSSPLLPTWDTNEKVTVIGDAVHLMSPAAGSGAVTALRDAHNLCRLLTEGGDTLAAISAYEALMREYAGQAIRFSLQAGSKIFQQTPFDQCKTVALT
ncbi:cercosporin toxin biosynthesis protein [Massariosphaeria phaeospora]|uniref:Cercosporin toxin biosynthesis protein n=1 Tax=Massariosphaeria phaeospora TaxID=100035 RepID=A0A7C8MJW7_9PLEO|nr:cercosporin toxin biosynthesis protein [Massariosphaeria phaeospora]